jgi:hypothetical protein
VVPELRPRTVGEILDVAVLLYRARFGPLMKVTLAVTLPVSLLTMFVLLSAVPDDEGAAFGFNIMSPFFFSGSDSAAMLGAIVVTFILSTLSTAFVTAAATRIVGDVYVGGNETLGTSVKAVARRLLPLIGLTFLTTIAVAITCIAGYVLSVFWAVAVPALILEGTKVFRSMGRSFELTKAAFWLAFGVYWLGQLLVFALSLGLAGLFTLLITTADSASADVIAQSVGTAIATVVTTPFLAAAVVALYFDLRIRNEGFDIQMMIAQLDRMAVRA